MGVEISQVNLPEIIGRRVRLTRYGKTYKACCPFHNEKTASFSLRWHVDRWRFYCFGCGVGGDAFDWVCMTQNVSFKEAAEILETGAPKPTKQELWKKEEETKQEQLRQKKRVIFFNRNPECPVPDWAIDWDAPKVPRGTWDLPPEVNENV